MTTQLSPVTAYVQSVNAHDPETFIGLFADDAIVNDAGREFRGRPAIKSWSDREVFGANVTLEVLDQTDRDDESSITTQVDGTFDRTGLPDPVIIIQQITTQGDKIVGLTCRLADQRQ